MSEEPNPAAIKSLQAFLLARNNKIVNCKHESIYTEGPGGEIIKETCYCGVKNLLHISPKLAADLISNSEFKTFHPGNEIKDGKLTKMFGVPVVVEDEPGFWGKN